MSDPNDSIPPEEQSELSNLGRNMMGSTGGHSPGSGGSGTGSSNQWLPPTAEELATMLPGYEITQMLGRGGMGAVYMGRQTSLDRIVAIKILSNALEETDADFAERFKNEARAMAKLEHPGIVAVYDFGETESGLLYIVMQYVDGTDVARMIAADGRLHTDHAMAITAHVCDALAYAHERGIIHRDIKPANIMVGYDGVVKVADFGLAKAHGGDAESVGLTQSGMVMGTMHYMAPEMIILGSTETDQRVDVYAVGVMLYHMLTGKVPHGMFELPSIQVQGLDPRYDGIVGKAMREDRDQRYQGAVDLRSDLDAILTQPVVHVEATEDAAAETPAALPTYARPQRPQGRRLLITGSDAEAPRSSVHPASKHTDSAGKWLFIAAVATLAIAGGWLKQQSDQNDKFEIVATETIISPDEKGKDNSTGTKSPSPEPTFPAAPSSEDATSLNSSGQPSLKTEPSQPLEVASTETNPTPPVPTTKEATTPTDPSTSAQATVKVSNPTNRWIDLMPLLTSKKAPSRGAWETGPDSISIELPSWAATRSAPFNQTAPYVILVRFNCATARRLFVGFPTPKGASQFGLVHAHNEMTLAGEIPHTEAMKFSVEDGEEHELELHIGETSFKALLDGRQIFEKAVLDWKDHQDSKLLLDEPGMGLVVHEGVVDFRAFKLKALTEYDHDSILGEWWQRTASSPQSAYRIEVQADGTALLHTTASTVAGEWATDETDLVFQWENNVTCEFLFDAFESSAEVITGQLQSGGTGVPVQLARDENTAWITKAHFSVDSILGNWVRTNTDRTGLAFEIKLNAGGSAKWIGDGGTVQGDWEIRGDSLEVAWRSNFTFLFKLSNSDQLRGLATWPDGSTSEIVYEKRKIAADRELVEATVDEPFVNSLGMKFVPVENTDVLFCIHETRVSDYEVFVEEENYAAMEWRDFLTEEPAITYRASDHPVSAVSWLDAQAFCKWLSKREGKNYRLPTYREWSEAVGIGEQQRQFSREEEGFWVAGFYPWGRSYPPPADAGNYSKGDRYPRTAPVMSFNPNHFGIFDLGGNNAEWIEDYAWGGESRNQRMLRGQHWMSYGMRPLQSSNYHPSSEERRVSGFGFRIVIESPSRTEAGRNSDIELKEIAKHLRSSNGTMIFNGTSLAGWKIIGDPDSFRVVDGMIVATSLPGNLYYVGNNPEGATSLRDFDLSLKLKADAKANSGIFIHAESDKDGENPALEADIRVDPSDIKRTGALWQVEPSSGQRISADKWCDFQLSVRGDTVTIYVNGELTTKWTQPQDWDPSGKLKFAKLGEGAIGIQSAGRGPVSFKNIELHLP